MVEHPPEVFTTDDPGMAHAMEGADASAHTEQHVQPSALDLEAFQWVGLAMLVFIGILIWKGVPKLITGGLDSKIAAIRTQLEEAKALRAEAEALRNEYAAKIAGAEKDAAAMIENAKVEADGIVKKAEADTKALIARRERMAEDKIAGAERSAVEQLRASAATAATEAARGLIASKHDSAADQKLVNEVISAL
jgi:F-type H+-transporting ATPase subunit b